MTQPWFNPNLYAWIPGTFLGVAGGIWGSLVGVMAPRGRAKRFVLGFSLVLTIIAAGLLAAGVIAFFEGQPYGIWYGLGFPGLMVIVLVNVLLPVVRRRYRQAEEYRMAAHDTL